MKGEKIPSGFVVWDRDGRGGAGGSVYKVRFCPTFPGEWTLVSVTSGDPELNGQGHGTHPELC